MTDKILIGVVGKSGSGKDEFAKAIISSKSDRLLITRIALADALKEEVDYIGPFAMCVDYNISYDKNPPLNDPFCRTEHGKQRALLQFWGQYRRNQDPFYWVKRLDERIQNSNANIVIIPGVRYKNEVYYVKRTGFTVRVIRNGYEGLTGEAASHISENELNNLKTDYVIEVEKDSLQTMHQKSCEVFEDIVSKFDINGLTEEDLNDQ